METMSTGVSPWLVLVGSIVGFILGYLVGRPRSIWATWFVPDIGPDTGPRCNQPCNCKGANCTVPVGAPSPHVHCPKANTEVACAGTCTLARGHAGPHLCSDVHTF